MSRECAAKTVGDRERAREVDIFNKRFFRASAPVPPAESIVDERTTFIKIIVRRNIVCKGTKGAKSGGLESRGEISAVEATYHDHADLGETDRATTVS